MKRFTAIGLCSVMLVGAHALAAPPATQAAIMKRQLQECMAKRMGANRTLSYNDAMRTCKDRAAFKGSLGVHWPKRIRH